MSYSATVTLTSGTANANLSNFTITVYDGGGLRATLATGVTRASLAAGYGVSGILDTDQFIRVASNGTCVNSVDYYLPAATPTPTPTPVTTVCYSGASPSYPNTTNSSTGTLQLKVVGGSINVWGYYNSAGASSGSATWNITVNGVTLSSSAVTIAITNQPNWTSSGGTSGHTTLTPGIYTVQYTKTDSIGSGAYVGIAWSSTSNTFGNASTYLAPASTC